MERIVHPAALPGSCYICGSADREYYIDTKLSVEFHGAMYFCNLCIGEMATLVGFMAPEIAESIRQRTFQLEKESETLKNQVNGLEQAVNGFFAAGFGSRTDSDDVPGTDSVVPAETAETGTNDVGTRTDSDAESVHDEGVAILPDDAESHTFTLQL